MQGTQVWALAGELGSHIPWGAAINNNKPSNREVQDQMASLVSSESFME